MMDAEGSIYIPLEEFWQFVSQYNQMKGCEMLYGVPRVVGNDLVISYAASSECHPSTWAKKPVAALEWDKMKPVHQEGGAK